MVSDHPSYHDLYKTYVGTIQAATFGQAVLVVLVLLLEHFRGNNFRSAYDAVAFEGRCGNAVP